MGKALFFSISRGSKPVPLADRIWPKVVKTHSCWHYLGALDHGYSVCGRSPEAERRGNIRVHKWIWESMNGPVPSGLVLDHLCRNRWCVNPSHLQPVTNKENVLRGTGLSSVNAKKTHCIRGHAFDDRNTGRDVRGDRRCRECARIRFHARKRRMTVDEYLKQANL